MKNKITIAVLLLTLMSAIGCKPNVEVYDGEADIKQSIEKSKNKLNDTLKRIDSIYTDGYSDIDDIRTNIQEAGMTETEAKNSIMRACPVLFSEEINSIELLGQDGIDARALLDIAYEEAKEVDSTNKQEVNKAIKKIENAWDKLKPILYSARFKISALFADCISKIEAIPSSLSD